MTVFLRDVRDSEPFSEDRRESRCQGRVSIHTVILNKFLVTSIPIGTIRRRARAHPSGHSYMRMVSLRNGLRSGPDARALTGVQQDGQT